MAGEAQMFSQDTAVPEFSLPSPDKEASDATSAEESQQGETTLLEAKVDDGYFEKASESEPASQETTVAE